MRKMSWVPVVATISIFCACVGRAETLNLRSANEGDGWKFCFATMRKSSEETHALLRSKIAGQLRDGETIKNLSLLGPLHDRTLSTDAGNTFEFSLEGEVQTRSDTFPRLMRDAGIAMTGRMIWRKSKATCEIIYDRLTISGMGINERLSNFDRDCETTKCLLEKMESFKN